ncbi:MAG TPA: T9SS type A sorting domain-containing protein [Rhodothermales bacterium]|nr:T9SS type A sorting domain-containing protein [Rhodothermales bacterium]
MRLATLLFVLVALAPSAFAQGTPPDPWLFYPLAVGNTWEYRHWGLPGFERRVVERDTVIDGHRYFDHATYTSPNAGVWTLRSRALLRFDTTASRVVARQATGQETLAFCAIVTYGLVSCDPSVFAGGGTSQGFVGYAGQTLLVGSHQVNVLARVVVHGSYPFSVDPDWVPYFAAPIGYVGAEPYSCVLCGSRLMYARVGGTTYGSPFVAAEAPLDHSTFALAATPNPATGPLVLTLALPTAGPVTVEAFDVTGRRVHHAAPTLAAGAHTLDVDASAWAPGLYVVRATTTDGGTATARVVRR